MRTLFDEQRLTLSQFCQLIDHALQHELPATYWVSAEIGSISRKGGHGYFDLVEKADNDGLYAARLRAICWANRFPLLCSAFAQATGMSLKAGIKVLLAVRVNFHAAYGLSLIIEDIDPTFTLGDIAQQRQQTLDRLQREGVIEMNKLLPFPRLPQHIAVVSAADAAGYGDFEHQLMHNEQHFAFRTELFAAIMQGDRAARSIQQALWEINQRIEEFDVVLITRGGGAVSDLTCFDDYDLANVCAQFPLPVIAAIGHTKDVSVVDIVAHTSVKTPTAAAALLIDKMDEQLNAILAIEQRLHYAVQSVSRLHLQKLEQYRMNILRIANIKAERELARLAIAQKTIELHSPSNILQKGYSITLVNGKPLRSAKAIQAGQTIVTELVDGKITSVVTA